ncbi:MAG: dienelactone hydrolase family protein [Thermoanaerobaculia bacterium]
MRRLILPLLLPLLVACTTSVQTPSPAASPGARLENTPRHDEWVTIESAGRTLHAYVVYPQVSRKAGSVVVIHENRGLTDWVRSVADRLAEAGYIAVAPDFLSGAAPNGGRTSDFPTQDAAREAISKLTRPGVRDDLVRVVEWMRKIPSANGKVAVAGFCWGGSRAWDAANGVEGLARTFVFYGTGPDDDTSVAGIDGPVFGFYGGDDERVNATIGATRAAMQRQDKVFDPVIYPGAGHAFMRLGEEASGTEANRSARDQAWTRWLRELKAIE